MICAQKASIYYMDNQSSNQISEYIVWCNNQSVLICHLTYPWFLACEAITSEYGVHIKMLSGRGNPYDNISADY